MRLDGCIQAWMDDSKQLQQNNWVHTHTCKQKHTALTCAHVCMVMCASVYTCIQLFAYPLMHLLLCFSASLQYLHLTNDACMCDQLHCVLVCFLLSVMLLWFQTAAMCILSSGGANNSFGTCVHVCALQNQLS